MNGNLIAGYKVTCPTEDDQRMLEDEYKIPIIFFRTSAIPMSVRAMSTTTDGCLSSCIIPYVKEIRSRTPTTVPLGIIHKRDVTITVCYCRNQHDDRFRRAFSRNAEGFTDYVDMIFRLFLSSSVWYLKRLKQINTLIEKAKHNLDHEVNNESLIGLSRLQDSLTLFHPHPYVAMKICWQSWSSNYKLDELDADLKTSTSRWHSARNHQYILWYFGSTMDTYSSIINNNMKRWCVHSSVEYHHDVPQANS